MGTYWYFIVIWIWISLMSRDVEQLFNCVWPFLYLFFGKVWVKLSLDCLFSYSRAVRVLYLCWIQILCQYRYCKCFLLVLGLHFHFLTHVFWKTAALIWNNSNASASVFILWLVLFLVFLRNSCLSQSCEDFLLFFVR